MTTLRPRHIAAVAERLRAQTIALLDELSDDDLEVEALPRWSVADVFAHLATADRDVVVGRHLLDFLPSRGDTMEASNDVAIQRLQGASREVLRRDLDRWGRWLRRVVQLSPAPLSRVQIPTMFGRVSLAWFAALRPYDEWVHQDDIRRALGRGRAQLDDELRELFAEFQMRALPALPLQRVDRRPDVIEIDLADVPEWTPWRFDLETRQFGTEVSAQPTARVTTDIGTFTLLAADRVAWREAQNDGLLEVTGDGDAAATLLDVVRVV